MSKKSYFFTSESVSEGHPDKVCDRISDMVVDTYISKEPLSRVACETLATTNKVILAGETRGPEIKKEDLIQKVLTVLKILDMSRKGFIGKIVILMFIYIHNQQILLWELTLKETKTKEQEIKVLCLVMLVTKPKF